MPPIVLVGLKADLKTPSESSTASLVGNGSDAHSLQVHIAGSPQFESASSPALRTGNGKQQVVPSSLGDDELKCDSALAVRRLWEQEAPVERETVERVKRALGAAAYVECSALKQVLQWYNTEKRVHRLARLRLASATLIVK